MCEHPNAILNKMTVVSQTCMSNRAYEEELIRVDIGKLIVAVTTK